ncbi:MAG: competence/damage-inducible protein A [Oscillospiraceae bacterium]|nr:competence/damage-inducible protein A [Oscillospiraceae bacterium]
MNAEIISVGTELLLGGTINTDAADVSRALAELGINVYRHTVVGDNPERLAAAAREARERAELIVTTGGLGPTCDDLTKQTLCRVFGLETCRDAEAEARLRQYFAAMGRKITENNFQQCYLPRGCTPFYNTCGTAPGCAFQAEGVTVIMLPGPPRECRAMLARSAVPYLRALSDEVIRSHTIHIYGLGESKVESMLRERMLSLENPTLAPYCREGEVFLRITAKAADAKTAEAMIAPVAEEVRALFGDFVYGTDCAGLEWRCLELLRERGMTFSAAESCTGGLVAKRMTDVPGASEVFRGGATVYTNDAKMRLAGVSAAALDRFGAVSEPVAAELAQGIRRALDADFGIGVTGLAGPDGDGVNPVGTVYIGLASAEGVSVQKLSLPPTLGREGIRTRSATAAFSMLFNALRRKGA